jgi:hypothetical protein
MPFSTKEQFLISPFMLVKVNAYYQYSNVCHMTYDKIIMEYEEENCNQLCVHRKTAVFNK